jgi:hypothetical protein
MCPEQVGGITVGAEVWRPDARKFLINLSGSGIPLTCTKVLNQE